MSLMGAYAKDDYLTRDELRALPVPEPQGPWHNPVGFGDFVDLVEDELRRQSILVASEEHYTMAKGNRHFGLLTLASNEGVMGGSKGDWSLMLGIRGSHDQSISRGLATGRHVTVCSNGMFTGDLGEMSTKQSTHIWDRLRELVRTAAGKVRDALYMEQANVAGLKSSRIERQWGDNLLVDMYRAGGLSSQQLGHALHEWENPSYGDHLRWGRTLWLLEQAVTQALKPTGHQPLSPATLEHKTRRCNEIIQRAKG